MDALTAEESKLLEHLRGLQHMGVELTQNMTAQMERLVMREAKTTASRALSHGHLNRLNKLRAQVTAATKRIQSLDSEWTKFVHSTTAKLQQHAAMYQQYRADMMESLNQRMSELQEIKKQVGEASQHLLTQHLQQEPIPEVPEVAEQLRQVQEMVATAGHVADPIDLTVGMEEDMGETMESPNYSHQRGSPKPVKFKASTTPTKVANQHLKQKPEKAEK